MKINTVYNHKNAKKVFKIFKEELPSNNPFKKSSTPIIILHGIKLEFDKKDSVIHIFSTENNIYNELPQRYLLILRKYGVIDGCKLISIIKSANTLANIEIDLCSIETGQGSVLNTSNLLLERKFYLKKINQLSNYFLDIQQE